MFGEYWLMKIPLNYFYKIYTRRTAIAFNQMFWVGGIFKSSASKAMEKEYQLEGEKNPLSIICNRSLPITDQDFT